MTIRVATLHDVRTISDIRIRSWRHIYKDDMGKDDLAALDPRKTDQRWQVMIDGTTPRSRILVDEDDAALTGFIALEPANADHFGYEGYLSAIYLEPEYMARGIGRALFDAGCAWMRSAGYRDVFWWVIEANRRAIAFYEKLGAKRVPGSQRACHAHAPQLLEFGYGMSLVPA